MYCFKTGCTSYDFSQLGLMPEGTSFLTKSCTNSSCNQLHCRNRICG